MGFDVSHLPQVQSLHSSLKKAVLSRHKRCKSDSDRRFKRDEVDLPSIAMPPGTEEEEKEEDQVVETTPLPDVETQTNLQQEILLLEKRLKGQFALRHALEKALGYRTSQLDSPFDGQMPKPTRELIREIAVLEVEVRYLEQYLLSLYRKAFGDQPFSLSPSRVEHERTEALPDTSQNSPKQRNSSSFSACPKKLTGPGAHRSHSALSQQSENLTRALRECHSQPLSSLDNEQGAVTAAAEVISLAEYLGTSMAEHLPETANKLSEELVRCVGKIFCKLAETPLVCSGGGLSSSPTSSFSSMCPFSPQYHSQPLSPTRRKEVSAMDAWLDNPFRVEGLKEFSGPYNLMVEVPAFCFSADRLAEVEDMLVRFKSLASRLESLDPRKLKHEERVAFWVNIHNASVMHAYLVNGVPLNNLKRLGLLLKASCNVGGRIVSADAIQSSILKCRTHRPAQWLRAFLSPGLKGKKADDCQAYAIDSPEPLLHFALCSGSLSDPAVRVYTPKKLQAELEKAREEYIRAAVSIRKEQKILLPKLVEAFAKDEGMSSDDLLSMIRRYLPQTIQMAMRRCQQGRSQKVIEWVPHSLAFRYLLSRELAATDLK